MPHPEARSEKKLPTAQPNMAGQPKAIPKVGLSAAEILTLDTSNASRYLFAANVVMKNIANDIEKIIKLFLFRNLFIFFTVLTILIDRYCGEKSKKAV